MKARKTEKEVTLAKIIEKLTKLIDDTHKNSIHIPGFIKNRLNRIKQEIKDINNYEDLIYEKTKKNG
jgi:hypothetical protein